MGSSDPLPAGFEIRFGSLNFQATGNGYLMRITNRAELHPWRPTGPDRSPPRLLLSPRHPHRRASRALPHLDADAVQASIHVGRQRNDAGPRPTRHDTTHPSTRRRRRKGFPTGSVTPQPPTHHPRAPTLRCTTTSPATTSWRPETSSPPCKCNQAPKWVFVMLTT
jgi:hypothetical protein